MIVEAEKFHDVASANWRARNVSGVVLVQTQRSENQGSRLTFPLCHFVLFRSSSSWMMTIFIGEGIFFQSTDSNVNLFLKDAPKHRHRNVSPAIQASLSPVRLTHKINHHNSHQIISVETGEFLQSEHTHELPLNQKIKHLHFHPESFLVPPSSFKANYCFDFYCYRLVLQVFKPYINGIT